MGQKQEKILLLCKIHLHSKYKLLTSRTSLVNQRTRRSGKKLLVIKWNNDRRKISRCESKEQRELSKSSDRIIVQFKVQRARGCKFSTCGRRTKCVLENERLISSKQATVGFKGSKSNTIFLPDE